MFNRSKKIDQALAGLDFSQSALREPSTFSLAQLAELGIGSELTALAYGQYGQLWGAVRRRTDLRHAVDPVQSLLAVGTEEGRVYVFGSPGVQLSWEAGRGKIKHLAFRPGSGFIVCVGELRHEKLDETVADGPANQIPRTHCPCTICPRWRRTRRSPCGTRRCPCAAPSRTSQSKSSRAAAN
jgi:hypothetical protein